MSTLARSRSAPWALILALPLALVTGLASPRPSEAAEAAGATFHVSPTGSDSAPGTMAAPFATLAKAQSAARAAGPGTSVVLREGTWSLTAPLTFDNRDSGIAWRAQTGEKPLISGAKAITGTWTNKGALGNGTHWTVPVPDAAAWNFRDLYIDNERQTRSRWPNETRAVDDRGPAASSPYLTMTGFNTDRSRIDIKETIPTPNLAGSDAEFVVHSVWSEFRNKVVSSTAHSMNFTPKPGGMAVGLDQMYLRVADEGAEFLGKKFWPYNSYLENALVFLDHKQEWYLDKAAKTLHVVLPAGTDPNAADVTAPVAEKLITVQGASPANPVTGLSFTGIDFGHTEWKLPASGYNEMQATQWVEDGNLGGDGWAHYSMGHALQFVNTRGLVLSDIKLAHTGGGGIALGAGVRGSRLTGNELFDIGGNGISVGWWGDDRKQKPSTDWTDTADTPVDNHVTQSYLHDVGAKYAGGIGVYVGQTDGSVIRNNEIAGGGYTGISAGWNWYSVPTSAKNNLIENNDIHHVMRSLADGGGIYVLGQQPGSRMTGNHVHDIVMDHYTKGWLANGIYLDQGTGGWHIGDNVSVKVPLIPLHFNESMGVGMSSATWGTNWYDGRYPPTPDHGGPKGPTGHTFNVASPPANVAALIAAAGPASTYQHLYATNDSPLDRGPHRRAVPVVSVDPATTDSTPTFTWMSATGATKDRYGMGSAPTAWTETTAKTFTPAAPLADGTHTLSVQSFVNGAWTASGRASTTIDTTAPAVPTVTGNSPQWYQPARWTWPAVPGASGYEVRLTKEGQVLTDWTAVSGTAYERAGLTGPAGHLLQVRALDAAGNRSAAGAATVTVPAAPPVPGTDNLARGKNSTASSSWDTDHGAAKAFDGDTGTLWAPNTVNGTAWLQVDLGSPKTYVGAVLKARTTSGHATGVVLQRSDDGVTFTDIPGTTAAGIGPVGSALNTVPIRFAPVTSRYLRLAVTGMSGVANVNEFELYADETTPTPPNRDARSTIEAETFDARSGSVQAEACAEGGQNLGYIADGNWTKYTAVDFGAGVGRIDLRAATLAASGQAEIRVDSPTGPLLGTVTVTGTGAWQTYATTTQNLTSVTGTHDLYLVYKKTGSGSGIMNVNWFRFA